MREVVLEVKSLTRSFGGLQAVLDVSFNTTSGEILGVIGPNGAGKTTLFSLIVGAIGVSRGQVGFRGRDVTGHSTDEIARLGLVRTFQAATVFREETVLENLRRGSLFGRIGKPGWFLKRGNVSGSSRNALRRAEEVLEFTGLARDAGSRAGDLPYGKQKMLGVGIALASGPRQLLMDEPAAGLNPNETQSMARLIARIRSERGVDVILIEHDMGMVTEVCDRILVLNYGKLIGIGSPDTIMANPEVIQAYLGVEHDNF